MFFSEKRCFIVGDVGGTKTLLAVMDEKHDVLFTKQYVSSEVKNFTDILVEFMSNPECKRLKILDGCIAVAGMINSDRNYARLTNLDWAVDTQSILVRTSLRKVVLLNDFEAVGFSMDTLKADQYVELTNIGRVSVGTIAIIGAGTGLGMSIVPFNDKRHIPLPSEGGHVDLPILSNDPMDIQLQSYMVKKKLYHDAEDVVSGRGIVHIYDFLNTQNFKHGKDMRLTIIKSLPQSRPALITKYALEDKDALCIRTLELFIKYYARISKNLALTTLCTEFMITGGIAPKILPAMQDEFLEEFAKHDVDYVRKYLERIPIFVITDPYVVLHGALNAIK